LTRDDRRVIKAVPPTSTKWQEDRGPACVAEAMRGIPLSAWASRRAVRDLGLTGLLFVFVVVPVPGAAQAPSPPAVAAVAGDYVIGSGDVLQVVVWKEPDVSREVRVRSDGKITVALLGDVAAAGSTPAALADVLTQRLTRYLTAPKVTVSVVTAASLRFSVVGEVNKPGEFLLNGRVTVLEALALAGGFTPDARTNKIIVVRSAPGAPASADARPRGNGSILRVNYKDISSGRDLRGNVPLRPGDTVVVP
jgi:polysaccharide biosynthesis/export protein